MTLQIEDPTLKRHTDFLSYPYHRLDISQISKTWVWVGADFNNQFMCFESISFHIQSLCLVLLGVPGKLDENNIF